MSARARQRHERAWGSAVVVFAYPLVGGDNPSVGAKKGSVSEIVDRVRVENLIPPVKSIEMIGDGVIRVTVRGPLSPELHSRLKLAIGDLRWRLVET